MRARLWLCACLVALSACSGGGGNVVNMPAEHVFEPETITVKVGDEVTWKNGSSEQHTVTADQGSIPSGADYFASGDAPSEEAANDDLTGGLIGPGDEYSTTFDAPGTYHYYCILHRADGMKGTVVVKP